MTISQWSTTPGNNNSAAPNGAPEGWAPSAVNDTIRQQMADHKTQWLDAQWFNRGDSGLSQASTSSFKLTSDLTSVYEAGRRIKCYDASTLYGVIASSSYSAPDTTVNVTLDSGNLSASLSSVAIGILSVTSPALPTKFQTLNVLGASSLSGAVVCKGAVTIEGATTLSGAVNLTTTLNVAGATTLSGATVCKGAVTIEGATTLSGAVNLTTTLNVAGAATLSGAVVCKSAATLESTATISGQAVCKTGLTVEGATTLSGAVVCKGTLTVSGAPVPILVQRVGNQTGALATGTTVIAVDNTIPQNTEGDQYLSQAITPLSASNKLEITVVLNATHSIAGSGILVALFQDTTANALACTFSPNVYTNTAGNVIYLRHTMTAGTTSSTTFKVRAGSGNAGTLSVNGQAGSQLFGGVLISSITIKEYTA